jgi:hypothetical protein
MIKTLMYHLIDTLSIKHHGCSEAGLPTTITASEAPDRNLAQGGQYLDWLSPAKLAHVDMAAHCSSCARLKGVFWLIRSVANVVLSVGVLVC